MRRPTALAEALCYVPSSSRHTAHIYYHVMLCGKGVTPFYLAPKRSRRFTRMLALCSQNVRPGWSSQAKVAFREGLKPLIQAQLFLILILSIITDQAFARDDHPVPVFHVLNVDDLNLQSYPFPTSLLIPPITLPSRRRPSHSALHSSTHKNTPHPLHDNVPLDFDFKLG